MRIKVIMGVEDFILTNPISHHKKTHQREISDTCSELQIPFMEIFNYILVVFFFFFNVMSFFSWLLLGIHSLLFFFFFWIICVCSSFSLCWVFIIMLRFFLVAASGTLCCGAWASLVSEYRLQAHGLQ